MAMSLDDALVALDAQKVEIAAVKAMVADLKAAQADPVKVDAVVNGVLANTADLATVRA